MPLKGIFDIETDSEGRKSFKWLVIFCIALFALWSALPMILLENTYIDILENIVWSRHFQFGYDKNPYFGAWLTQACYILSGHGIWINYVLSQLSVLIGFLCVWKLARSFLPPLQSLISVMLLTGVLFYGSKTIEFNDDVLEIALWSLSMLFFHRALTKQQLLDWLFVGLWTGLAFMTKYYGLVLFASMGLVMLLTKEGRGSFRKPGPWLSLALFLVLSLPNIVWLWQNDFVAIRYAMGRAKLSGKTISGEDTVVLDYQKLGEAVGMKSENIRIVDAYKKVEVEKAIKDALAAKGVQLIVVKGLCQILRRKMKKAEGEVKK